ncbi:MAG: PAS domain S-box protein, partial [Desulfobacterales bacterium]|nr:PAS domain S-box protein [Desulfobacterales bacterium]
MKNKPVFLKSDKLPSISTRLTISLTIAVVIVAAIVISLNYYSSSRKAKAQLDQKADEYVSFLLESLRVPLWTFEVETIKHTGSVYFQNDLISTLKIIGSNDVIYFSSKKNDSGFQVSRKKDIHYKGQFVGSAQLSLSSQNYYLAQKQLLRQSIIAIFCVLIVITVVTGFLLRAFLKRPLIHLSKTIAAHTSDISEIPTHHTTCEEFQPLLTVLDEMNEKLIRQMSEIQQAEEKYRSMFENAVEGMFQSTPEGRFITANPRLASIFGYDTPEDLISHVKNIGKQVYVDPTRRKEFFRLLEKNKVVKEFESEFYRKDGSVAVISENAREVRDEENNVVLIEGFIEDITDRKLAEKSLKESHETLITILDSIDATIYAADMETNEILFMNKHMKKNFGYNLEGKICHQVFRKESEPCQD